MDENSETESSPESMQSVIEKYLKEPTMSPILFPIGRVIKVIYLI